MKKIDTSALVKKVDLFEKLAVYGDRGSFLKALAQDSNTDPKVKSIIQQIQALLRGANVTDDSITNPISNALIGNVVDVAAVASATMRAATKLSGVGQADTSSKLFNLWKELMHVSTGLGNSSSEPGEEVPESIKRPEEAAPALQGKTHGYPTIDKEEQRALGKILTIEGMGLPLEADGAFGPKTKAALQAFKQKFHLSSMTDAQALSWAKMLAETDKYR